MNALLHDWVWGLTTAAVLAACANALCDKGAVSRVLRFACALLLLSALLGPFRGMDWEEYALALHEARESARALSGELEERNQSLERLYIEEECNAYILDEAKKLGLEGHAEVRAKWTDKAFLPWEVTLRFGEEADLQALSALIEAELGIPEERQYRK